MQALLIDSILVVLVLSGIPMLSITVSSGIVALIQAATQIQEQSILHLVKFITFLGVVFVLGDWAGGEVVALFERSIKALEAVGR